MHFYFIVTFLAFLLSVVFTLIAKKAAIKFNLVDFPDKNRKIHQKPTPLGGGIGIFLSFFLVSLCLVFFTDTVIGKYISLSMMAGIWAAGFIIVIGGTLDDKKNLSPVKQIIWPVSAIIIAIIPE